MRSCNHDDVRCLNQFELIRKYRCLRCGMVMMCACDESNGRRFLQHQLDRGTELETQQWIPVTGGFQPAICRACRGLPPEAYPVASIPGRTTKIRRYYWRELAFREMELFAEWAKAHGVSPEEVTGPEAETVRKEVAEQALQEIKQLHETTPKYIFREESQSEIIQKYRIEVLKLKGAYEKIKAGEKARILDAGESLSPEEFVRRHFSHQGYESLRVESVPFHVLFGIYMWLVIQDPADPHVRIVGFGDRTSFDAGLPSRQIWLSLPDDFGTPAYGKRRDAAIREHLSPAMQDRDKLEWLFDYWLAYSEALRQYLWAHREDDIKTARQLIQSLPPEVICHILRYLVDDYWHRYCGWPDLVVYKGNEFFFVEVKSSGDKLSEDQKNWIRNNDKLLKLPFKLVKIHRMG